jgi:hypothetical protein
MQSKGQSRRREHRQNYATGVNTEVNMPTPAPRSDAGKGRSQSRTSREWNFQTDIGSESQLLICAE